MAMLSARVSPEVESAQVWPQLDTNLRQLAISVVAQMAFNLVQTQTASSQPEENDDDHAPVLD